MDEEDDVYDYVDEDTYKDIVKSRKNAGDFVVDDSKSFLVPSASFHPNTFFFLFLLQMALVIMTMVKKASVVKVSKAEKEVKL